MKRFYRLFVIIFFGVVFEGKSQTSLGFKAGFSSSQIIFSPIQVNLMSVDIDQRTNGGILIGAVGRHFFQKHSGIQAELNYIQKGWTELFSEINEEFTTDLNYIELSTLAHFNIGRGKIKPVILAGPRISYFITESEQSVNPELIDGEGTLGVDEVTYRVTDDNLNDVLFGLAFGAGVSADTGLGSFQLDFQFDIDFSRVFDDSAPGSPPFSQNSSILISLSYFFWTWDKK